MWKFNERKTWGAVAVVIMNNVNGDELINPSGGTNATPTIPMIFISENSGNTLKADLISDPSLEVTMKSSALSYGVDPSVPVETRIRLHAPNPVQPGSSVSHFSTATAPNLLMEPFINSDVPSDLDLSPILLKDIGWQTCDIKIPHIKYDIWLRENGLIEGELNTNPEDDFDNDGVPNAVEYVQDQNPVQDSSELFKNLDITTGSLSYERSTILNDAIISYQSATNLLDWTPISLSESTQPIDTQHEQVTIPISISGGNKSFFYRYCVELEE